MSGSFVSIGSGEELRSFLFVTSRISQSTELDVLVKVEVREEGRGVCLFVVALGTVAIVGGGDGAVAFASVVGVGDEDGGSTLGLLVVVAALAALAVTFWEAVATVVVVVVIVETLGVTVEGVS